MAITVYVLDCGDLFFQLFNVIAAWMNASNYMSLVSFSVAFGFFVAVVRSFKSFNPMTMVKWFITYFLVFQIAILPKTDVVVHDVSNQSNYPVSNVPLVFAVFAEGLTGFGYGMAQIFDSLFATLNNAPQSVQYTQTGFLFGSKLIQESRNFKVTDPVLKSDLSMYFKRCVVGDVYVSHILSPTELKESTNIWEAISKNPSKIRRTIVTNEEGTGDNLTCAQAIPKLKERLQKEIKRAYTIFGINLFGKPKNTPYEQLFSTHLQSAFNYYQDIQTTGSNLFLQSMMINFIQDGVKNYQSYLNSSASVMNHEFTKSQLQQIYSWIIGGQNAAWILPLLHSVIMFLCMALFPLILLFVIAFSGLESLKSYAVLFLSLQLWPLCFAILNFVMAYYGSSVSENYGAMTFANLDDMERLHAQVSALAGFMMFPIPWLAYGILTRIGDSFNSLSHSFISGLQGATSSAASEAASASFSLGQTSFYNATGNTLSANKHDTNFTSMAGNTTRMLDSGATLTRNTDGTEVIDASGTVSKGTTSISSSNAINGMLSNAAEVNSQAIASKSKQMNSLVSDGFNQLSQFSQMNSHDLRLGEGVSESETAQMQQAVSNVLGLASTVAEKTGMTKEQALTGLVNAGIQGQIGVNSERSILGKAAGLLWGADGNVYARAGYEKSDSTSNRSYDGFDKVLDSRQMQDFRHDYSMMQNFSKTHHLDTSDSKGASLINQAAADFRQAEHISSSLDANYSRAERISRAQSVTQTGGAAINQNLDQMFQEYVTSKVGQDQRNYLYGHPGDPGANAMLSDLANQFISDEGIKNKIIDTYGNTHHQINPDKRYGSDSHSIEAREKELRARFLGNKNQLTSEAENNAVSFSESSAHGLQNRVNTSMTGLQHATGNAENELAFKTKVYEQKVGNELQKGREKSHAKSIIKGE
ncbi:mating contact stabilization protein TraG [Legionella santicrucis]|uniref:Mating contact stabilization protein TraG n=1 Tax=Legionella santicrucis TaxID=45074 RepID=A0A0W0ZCF2_9GAMM|nr:conjugal transfer mating-pair stabilization protein TraG [Legionella santicrucis]KTD66478.1 mating contact stabilization protein TraG [Legionella santicrucis]